MHPVTLFGRYCAARWRAVGLWAVTAALFWVVGYFYRLPFEGFGYATVLSGVFGLALLGFGWPEYRRRCEAMQTLAENPRAFDGTLPAPATVLEENYQQALHAMRQELADTVAKVRAEQDDLLDYFTVWVHQVKTPLAALRLLLQAGDTPPRAELEAEVLATERYVGMVLGYLRLTSESSDLVLARTALDPVVRGVVRGFARVFILKKLTLHYEPCDVHAVTDGKWVGFILEQLLSNAVKYTSPGGCITIAVCDDELTVADTGIGIRAEDLPRIFEKGYTGANGRQEPTSTGLGLYLCATAAAKLGARLAAASTPGQGTAITLHLPQARAYE